jgi:choline dehydrogenase
MSSPIYRAFVQAGEQAGFKLTDDFNGAQQEGFGRYQRTIHKGERWSASYGYLRPIEGVRPNLTVISTGLVTRVLIENGRATGVEVVEGKGALTQVIQADKEVVVCAGAVQSPQILMLSGIGNPEHLDRFGIKAKVSSPGVGQNLQDHLDVTVIHEMTQPVSAYSAQKGIKKMGVGLRYLFNQTGPGADNFLQAGAFINSREGLSMPDIQLHLVNAIMMDHGNHDPQKDGFTVHACQLRPESRGTICLASDDPFAHPAIDPNYLAAEEDRRAMREAVKMVRDVCGQSALNALRGAEIMPGASVVTDEDIDGFIRRMGETIYHPVGTVAMGTGDDSPVDGQLRVRGVDGLRVVDASVMPTLVGGNTNAPTIMVAEKAADMMLGRPALAREETLAPA